MTEKIIARPSKRVADSRTVMTRSIMFQDINGINRLFGGRLMEWIDELAGVAARRHCGMPITTACVDTLQFKHAVYLNEILVLVAEVTYVGRTSMEVRVDSYVEDSATGERRLVNTAYLTEVCIGDDGRPSVVPYGLKPESAEERAEYEHARKRREIRRQRAAEGI